MTAAAFLAPPARPPHDPLWMTIGACGAWPVPIAASAVEVEPGSGALTLSPAPDSIRRLTENSGSLGGLRPPRHVTVDCENNIWLLGQTSGLLRRFDPCECRFVTVPCTLGIGTTARAIVNPRGIASADDNIFVCDAGPPGRLLLFDRRSFALRAVWAPPAGVVASPWSPHAVVVIGGTVYVADKANGGVHRFARWGGWLGFWGGFGAIDILAADCSGQLFAAISDAAQALRFAATGRISGQFTRAEEVAGQFALQIISVARNGVLDLRHLCSTSGATGFDADGELADLPPDPIPAFEQSGHWISGPHDSRIADCVWHRVCTKFMAAIPDGTTVSLATYTANVELPGTDIALLPDSAWTAVPPAPANQDALILSRPGRYLWMRITLGGNGRDTLRLCNYTLEYPRISLRRYLPAAFGSDPQSADFTDRFLANFDRGFRDVETVLDNRALLFDADSAPCTEGRDILGWIAAWIGLSLERGWPAAKRRRLVKQAGQLFACRGTVKGLRDTILLWLGWDTPIVRLRRSTCGPRCRPHDRLPDMPPLILEHWRVRRWLWLGKGRLGSDAVLWGETLLSRSQLGQTAQLGATRLDTSRNPLLDPFNAAANRFSLFLPARFVATGPQRAQLGRLVDEHRPADALASIVPVHARMRIGIQASIGFDTVIGCWPSGVTLDAAQLGRGTVLSGEGPGPRASRIGKSLRLQPARLPAALRKGECTA
jgi:phage tail-like protein